MFVILVYDAGLERVGKFHKVCKKYLVWVQRSVFEGEITLADYERLLFELEEVMDKERDSILVYKFRTKKYYKRESIGVEAPSSEDFIL
ncbi:MAG: CRISPR-associated endonuclease Cas2 [Epsilonproteobacteria bacterium]|nr:CRISPR-associated endonuclease Cas2 [Campylobacterota bacterium]NPA56156.1 CRISPR-associated endonuclease Cas2 [Campylobacterota bacterium]